MKLKTLIRLVDAGEVCCGTCILGGLVWLANICAATVSAPHDFTFWWITWKVIQMLVAMGLIFGTERLYEELMYAEQDLLSEAYKDALYHGLIPQDRGRDA